MVEWLIQWATLGTTFLERCVLGWDEHSHRSESMSTFFFYRFVHLGTILKEFLNQFNNVFGKKVENEQFVDFSSWNATIPHISSFAIEKQFQSVYTNAKINEVQCGIMRMIQCNYWLVKTEGAIFTYEVSNTLQIENFIKEFKFSVCLNMRSSKWNVSVRVLRLGEFCVDKALLCLDSIRAIHPYCQSIF